jgi:predicted MFS family arabinose efflux permease
MLALGVSFWAALTALGGASTGYAMLFATRLGVGVGEAVCAPAGTSWIGDIVPPHGRSRALAGFMMAVPIGVMLSFVASGPVAQAFGWRTALTLAAAPAVLLVPALLLLPDPPRSKTSTIPATAASLLRVPALWWITLSGAMLNFMLYAFSYFIAAFLTRFHGMSVAQAGIWSGLGSGAAGIAGALAVVAFGGRLRFAAGAALLAAPLAWVAIRLPRGEAHASIALLMLAYGLWQMYYGPVYATIQDIVPTELRATAMSMYFLAMYLCGGAFGPLLVGSLSDRFARIAGGGEAGRAAGLHDAMYVLPLMSAALAVVLWAGDRAARRYE